MAVSLNMVLVFLQGCVSVRVSLLHRDPIIGDQVFVLESCQADALYACQAGGPHHRSV
jgi:hypothetical protein